MVMKMTCIVQIITPNQTIVSADDAVTMENRIFDGMEKIHILSNDPPIVMMVYGNSDFENIPLENIISEYCKKTDFRKTDSVLKVKDDFLNYINNNLKTETIEEYLNVHLNAFKKEISKELENIDLKCLIQKKEKNNKTTEFKKYALDFEDLIPSNLTKKEKEILGNILEYYFFENLKDKRSGIVISGISKETMKASYSQFEMMLNTGNKVIYEDLDENINVEGNDIKIFAQDEVIKSFLNGIDKEMQQEISASLDYYINATLENLYTNLKEKELLDLNELKIIKDEINTLNENSIAEYTFEDDLTNKKIDNMTKISEELDRMSKEELINMSKILINITRIKQIINSERETVGGNVNTFALSLKHGVEKIN